MSAHSGPVHSKITRAVVIAVATLLGTATLSLAAPMAVGAAAEQPEATNSSAVACPEGWTVVNRVGTSPLGNGGTLDHYIVNGMELDVPAAPSTFQPLEATNAELATYGLPARPQGSDALAAWTRVMRTWRPTPDAGICAGPAGLHFQSVTSNWSGMVATSSSNLWNALNGEFTQPTYNSAGCSDASEASWVGLGGYGMWPLIQDGTYMEPGPKYFAFAEWLNSSNQNPPYTLQSVSVSPGNLMYTYVYYDSSSAKAEFFVQNETNGTNQTYWLSNASSYYTGKTIDFVDEKPWSTLPDFNEIPWSDTMEGEVNGSWYDLGNQSPITVIMEHNNTVLAEPGGMVTSTSFNDYWYACQ